MTSLSTQETKNTQEANQSKHLGLPHLSPNTQYVTSSFKLGIIAGGQLGKMLALAASNWDVATYILDNDPACPASSCCTQQTLGDPKNFDDVYTFGKSVDLLTYEIESINIEALLALKKDGKSIHPDPDILQVIQDKGTQKEFYTHHQIPTAPYFLVEGTQEITQALQSGKLHYPFVQKLRKGGYDGRGVSVIKNANDLNLLLTGPSVIESLVSIQAEISVLAARNSQGQIRCFPMVEMEFNSQANLVETLFCPSQLPPDLQEKATQLASQIIEKFNMCGLLAVEMFLDTSGQLYINEVAPRPHNSGHHTIESAYTSQYEQLLRAIFNYPLGSTEIKSPSVMLNLLGEPGFSGPVKYIGLPEALAVDGVKIHLYGKHQTRPFRKMGHVTILGKNIKEAQEKALYIKKILKVTAW